MRRVSSVVVFAVAIVVASMVAPDIQVSIGADVVQRAPAGFLAMQVGGRGRIEAPNGLYQHDGSVNLDTNRFQGRFAIYSIEGDGESTFGDDVSLFDKDCVAKFGRGPQCAHFVGVLNGYILEGFDTSDPGFVGQYQGRTSAKERFRIFFDPHPDGTRNFENLASFERGEVIARYKVREFASVDFRAGIFNSRGNYFLIESKPVTFNGRTVDFADVAPRITQIWHARNPEPDPDPDPIPTDQEPYGFKGEGKFDLRFPISGMLMSAG
jgi:hypothetical protein